MVGPELQYRQQLDAGHFLIQRCQECQKAIFYPRMICPHCGSNSLSWFQPTGRGTVYSTTVIRRKPEAGGDYNVALVDLEEGVRMMSRVDGIKPEDVEIGMLVQARLVDSADGKIVTFTPEVAQ